MIKLLHCADLHMGAAFPEIGSRRGRLLREAQKNTWRRVLDTALREKADLILVAGDLFDSNHISTECLDFFFHSIEKFPIPLCVLPGTHDPYDRYSVYRMERLTRYKKLFIFNETRGQSFSFKDLDLTVYGKALLPAGGKESPLSGLKPSGKTRYNVAMAHGTLDENHRCPDDCCVNPSEIQKSGMNYIALGHDHSFKECSAGKTRAYYSGPMETLQFGQKGGFILLVDLDEEKVEAEPVKIGRYEWREQQVKIKNTDMEDMIQQVKAMGGDNHLLRIHISGELPFYHMAALYRALEKISGDFFLLDFSFQNLSIRKDLPEEILPALSIPGQFHKLLQSKVEKAGSDERNIYEEALWRGYARLTEE